MATTDYSSLNNSLLIDQVSREAGRGSRSAATFNLLHGINHRKPGMNPAPSNTDSMGYTFFTKPVLNMAYNNINRVRKLEFLTDQDPNSMGCAIKCMLSPYIEDGRVPRDDISNVYRANGIEYHNVRSNIIDDRMAFIPLLTNSCRSLTGWPDMAVDLYTSEEGLAKETMSWIDGREEVLGTMDLTANFGNVDGDPVTALFDSWITWASKSATGAILPYPEFIVGKKNAYTTRIYRLVMDRSRRFVQKIACTGAAFPFAVPNAVAFNMDSSSPFATDNEEVSIPFRASGFLYNDPIIVKWFNQTVELFNPSMTDERRDIDMVLLTPDIANIFNFKGYPRININTVPGATRNKNYELCWYYDKAVVEAVLKS